MVVTRLQKQKAEFKKLRTTQAVALVEYLQSGEENDEYGGAPAWRVIYHPLHIQVIPQCIRDIAEQSLKRHYVFNWETGEDSCYGWQWVDILACICRDLGIVVKYEDCMGRGERQNRFGRAAYAALQEYVQGIW